MTSVIAKLFGRRVEKVAEVPKRRENPLLNHLRGVSPVGQEREEFSSAAAGKQRFLGELEKVREVVEGLETKLTKAANQGLTYACIYHANSPGPQGLRGLARAVYDYLEREGFNPSILPFLDQLGENYQITVTWD